MIEFLTFDIHRANVLTLSAKTIRVIFTLSPERMESGAQFKDARAAKGKCPPTLTRALRLRYRRSATVAVF